MPFGPPASNTGQRNHVIANWVAERGRIGNSCQLVLKWDSLVTPTRGRETMKKNCLGAISSGDYGGGISNVTLEVT